MQSVSKTTGQELIIKLFEENHEGVELLQKYRKLYDYYIQYEGESALRVKIQVMKDRIHASKYNKLPRETVIYFLKASLYGIDNIQSAVWDEESVLYNKGLVTMACYEMINNYE